MPVRWVRAKSVIVGDGSEPLRDTALVFDGAEIIDIRRGEEAPADADDFGEATIAPGFVDAHVHLIFDFQSDHELTRTSVVNSSRDVLLARAIRNGWDCLRGGVTTVRDLGDRDGIVASARDLIRFGLIPGPRIHSAGSPITITAGHCGWLGGRADSSEQIVALTRLLVANGHDLVKVMASGGNMTRESNKFLPQFSVEDLKLIVAEAHRGGLPVASHAHNAIAVRRSIAAGVDTVEHCGWYDENGDLDLREDDISLMLESGAMASLTFAGIARQLLPSPESVDSQAPGIAKSMSPSGGDLYADFDWARRLMAKGVPVIISSDAGVRFTPFSGFLESLRAGISALDVSAASAIHLATLVPARALREDSRIGSLEVGKVADVVVLDTQITEDSRELGNVRAVFRDGQMVVSGGQVIV